MAGVAHIIESLNHTQKCGKNCVCIYYLYNYIYIDILSWHLILKMLWLQVIVAASWPPFCIWIPSGEMLMADPSDSSRWAGNGRETCAIGPRVLSNSNLIFFKTYLYDILRYPLDILDMSRCLKYFIYVMHAHICISLNINININIYIYILLTSYLHLISW